MVKSSLKIVVLVFLACMLIMVTVPASAQNYGTVNPSSDIVTAQVEFKSSLTVDEALDVVKGLQIGFLNHRYEIGENVFTGGYLHTIGSSWAIEQAYLSAHRGFIEDVLLELEASEDSNNVNSEEMINDLLALDTAISEQGVLVSGAEVKGNLAQVESLREDSRVQQVSIIEDDKEPSDPLRVPDSFDNTFFASSCSEWWPNSGKITTTDSVVSGKRYVRQEMTWIDQCRLDTLKGYGSNTTYEPDAVYNNYDGNYYLGDGVDYWSSNYSSTYLDTNAFDSSDERVYTVGFSDVQSLVAGTTYYTYIRTNFGNSSTDTGKVLGQRGHRTPSWCYNPFCIFADETVFHVGAWNHSVPGTTYWWH